MLLGDDMQNPMFRKHLAAALPKLGEDCCKMVYPQFSERADPTGLDFSMPPAGCPDQGFFYPEDSNEA